MTTPKQLPPHSPADLTTHIGCIEELLEIKRRINAVKSALFALDGEIGDCAPLYTIDNDVEQTIGMILIAGHRDGIITFTKSTAEAQQ